MFRPAPVVDLIRDVVENVAKEILEQLKEANPDVKSLSYQHGHPLEIMKTLMEQDADPEKKFEKYPIIMLFQDFPEYTPGRIRGCYSDVNLHIVIAMNTSSELKAAQRYDKTFHPTLYPIYDEFLQQLDLSEAFYTSGTHNIQHTKLDRVFWGKEGLYGVDGNIFNDCIDAIEIKDLKLTINFSNRKPEVVPSTTVFTDAFTDTFA